MAEESKFDAAAFMSEVYNEAPPTKRTAVKKGEYKGYITDSDNSVQVSAFSRRDGTTGYRFTAQVRLEVPAQILSQIGKEDCFAYYDGWLDVNEQTGRIDVKSDKNVSLSRLVKACKLPAEWNMMMLRGRGPFLCMVDVEVDEKDAVLPEAERSTYNKITQVIPLN